MPDNSQLNIAGEESPGPCEIHFDQPSNGTLLLGLRGKWIIGEKIPAADDVQQQINSHRSIRQIAFDTAQLSGWDSALLTFLIKVVQQTQQNKIEIDEAIKKLVEEKTANQ